MSTALDQIKQKMVPILKESGVTRSSLFGSYVRGDNRAESDIDVLVELPKGSSLFDLVRLERKLEIVLEKKVDLLTYNSVHPLVKDYIYQYQMSII